MSDRSKTKLGSLSITNDFDRFAALDDDISYAQGMAALQTDAPAVQTGGRVVQHIGGFGRPG